MNETHLMRACLAVTIAGMVALAVTYEPEFQKTTIKELQKKETGKGILFGRIESVVKNYPVTLFTLNDGDKALIYYPKATTLEKNDFVTVYAEKEPPPDGNLSKKTKESQAVYAHKVVKE